MNPVELVFHSGEYSSFRELFPAIRPRVSDLAACNRFLSRVILRTIFDACMYAAGNPNFESAKSWMTGDEDGAMPFSEFLELVGASNLRVYFDEMADEEGVHREKVRDMKRLLYNLDNHGGARESD